MNLSFFHTGLTGLTSVLGKGVEKLIRDSINKELKDVTTSNARQPGLVGNSSSSKPDFFLRGGSKSGWQRQLICKALNILYSIWFSTKQHFNIKKTPLYIICNTHI